MQCRRPRPWRRRRSGNSSSWPRRRRSSSNRRLPTTGSASAAGNRRCRRSTASFPDDPEAAAFYALALLATTPSDTSPRAHADQAAEILLRVYQRNPDHPGAMHYLVHANDVPGRERESLEITSKYETAAPQQSTRAPHADPHLHPPRRLERRDPGEPAGGGRGPAVSRGRPRRIRLGRVSPRDRVSRSMPISRKARTTTAAAQLKRLRSTARLEPTFKTAFHLASTQARYALERRAWNEAVLLVPREPATPRLGSFHLAGSHRAIRARPGRGAPGRGRRRPEQRSSGSNQLDEATRKAGEDLFARNIRVLRLELSSWLAHAERQEDSSVALMREAAELEASTPKPAVTPAPTLPAHELLGDLLMEQKHPADALRRVPALAGTLSEAFQQPAGRRPRRRAHLVTKPRRVRSIASFSKSRIAELGSRP